MLEWYEAYADFRDTMDRIETMLEQVALAALGTTVARLSEGVERDLLEQRLDPVHRVAGSRRTPRTAQRHRELGLMLVRDALVRKRRQSR